MVEKAKELSKAHGWFLTRQFENEANAHIHEVTTGKEIVECFSDTKLDYLVMGYGTGGTLKGVGKCLKEHMPHTKVILAEPDNAPLIFSGVPQTYKEDGSFQVGRYSGSAPLILSGVPKTDKKDGSFLVSILVP